MCFVISTCSIFHILMFAFGKSKEISTVLDDDDFQDDTTLEVNVDAKIDQYDESDKAWVREALVNVAYYLRSHKFNEFDRRYFSQHPDEKVSNMYNRFPEPPLKHFHWDVFDHCKSDLETCLRYLYETVVDTTWQYGTDTISIIHRRKLDVKNDWDAIARIEQECQKDMIANDSEPFRGPLERFQWRTTASYFMCKFTMQEEAQLQFFHESCDNMANCLQKGNRLSNSDIRANDEIPFACALYSFCPDPCCPEMKLVTNVNDCVKTESGNPCTLLSNSTCSLNKSTNLDMAAMIYNNWNVSCNCLGNSYWSSRYNMCIRYDKCHRLNSDCDWETQECWNNENETTCSCKFGYKSVDNNSTKCEPNPVLIKALQLFDGTYDESRGRQLNFNHYVAAYSAAIVFLQLTSGKCVHLMSLFL